jgi:hypothetical protein
MPRGGEDRSWRSRREEQRAARQARSESARMALRDRDRRRSGRRFARPVEFDESGFSITSRPPSFAERVRRLITGR